MTFGDVLAAIHRLLRAERERFRPRIANLGFDRKHHAPYLAPLILWPSMGAKPDEQKDQSQLSLTQRANIAFAVGCIAWLDSGCIETALPHVKK